jgi:hypothetical protein
MDRIFVSVREDFLTQLYGAQEYEEMYSNILPMLNNIILFKIEILSFYPDERIFRQYDSNKKIHLIHDAVHVENNSWSCGGDANINKSTDYLIRHTICSINHLFDHVVIGHAMNDDPVYDLFFKSLITINNNNEDDVIGVIVKKLWQEKEAKIVDEVLTRVYDGESITDILIEDKVKHIGFKLDNDAYQEFLKSSTENRNQAYIVWRDSLIKLIK